MPATATMNKNSNVDIGAPRVLMVYLNQSGSVGKTDCPARMDISKTPRNAAWMARIVEGGLAFLEERISASSRRISPRKTSPVYRTAEPTYKNQDQYRFVVSDQRDPPPGLAPLPFRDNGFAVLHSLLKKEIQFRLL